MAVGRNACGGLAMEDWDAKVGDLARAEVGLRAQDPAFGFGSAFVGP